MTILRTILIIAGCLAAMPARAELPVYVDTYKDGVVVKSKWYCANGARGPWPYCNRKPRRAAR